jgi:hypothetical protein
MSAQVANQPRPVESRQGAPSRGGNRGRGGHRGSHYRGARTNTKALDSKPPTILPDEKERDVAAVPVADEQSAEGAGDSHDVCWICAEPVKYYSVSECNHRTCHVCALRLRALYKKTDCAFCKASLSLFACLNCELSVLRIHNHLSYSPFPPMLCSALTPRTLFLTRT